MAPSRCFIASEEMWLAINVFYRQYSIVHSQWGGKSGALSSKMVKNSKWMCYASGVSNGYNIFLCILTMYLHPSGLHTVRFHNKYDVKTEIVVSVKGEKKLPRTAVEKHHSSWYSWY